MSKLVIFLLGSLFILNAVGLFVSDTSAASNFQAIEQKQQFAYVLKLNPRLLDDKNWTQQDREIIGKHFNRLKRLVEEGKVILAGKTLDNAAPGAFGIVILETDSEEEARVLMAEDYAVKGNLMTAQLFPFRVSLKR